MYNRSQLFTDLFRFQLQEQAKMWPFLWAGWDARPTQDSFYLKKTTFIVQRTPIYVVFLLTVVNCVSKLRNCVRK
jgi:hypothetical protein